MTVADLGAAAERALDAVHGDQIDLPCVKCRFHQIIIGPKGDCIALRIDLCDIAAVGRRNSESSALSQRVMNDAFVAPQHISVGIHKVSRGTFLPAVAADKSGIIAVRNKAYILTVVLIGVLKTALRSDLPGRMLILIAQRELHVGQLLLGQNIENITLVFGRVHCFEQLIASALFVIAHSCIVTGHQYIAAQFFHLLVQMLKFELSVALDAGIGRAAVKVFVDEGLDHFLPEQVLIVHDMVGNPDLLCHAAGVLRILERTAGIHQIHSHNIVFIQPHCAAHTIISLARHHPGSNAAVHAAAHRDQCSHLLIPFPVQYVS